MMKSLGLLSVVVVVGMVWSVKAACPKLNLKTDFNTDKFLGTWYEIQAQPSIFQPIKSCLKSLYTRKDPTTIEITSKGLDSSLNPEQTTNNLIIVDPNNPAHMVTDFVPSVQPPFDIVDTDYTNYFCLHSCLEIFTIKSEFMFVYGRNRSLETKYIDHCRGLFEGYGLDTSTLVETPQLNCHDHTDL